MAWIELHQSLWTHRKTIMLADFLDIDEIYAAAHMAKLWTWALDNAQDGDLSSLTDRVIAVGSGWKGDPSEFVNAIRDAGWLDQDGNIHDWFDYAGRLIDQRKAQAEYKQRQYSLYNDLRLTRAVKQRDGDVCQYCGKTVNWNDRRGADGGTYDHIDPKGDNVLENIVVSCRSCTSKKGKRTPEQANMPLITGGYTVSNRQISGKKQVNNSAITVPNQTKPNQKIKTYAPDGADVQAQKSSDQPGEQRKRAKTQGKNELFAKFWAAYPKKRSKGQAEKAWDKLKPDEQLVETMLSAIERAKKSEEWQKDNGQYIPYPASWLNAKCWEDEYTIAEVNAGAKHRGLDAGPSAYGKAATQESRFAGLARNGGTGQPVSGGQNNQVGGGTGTPQKDT